MELKRELVITAVIALVIGLIAGYTFWGGKKEEKVDVKQMLLRAVEEVEALEDENRKLHGTIKQRQDDTEKVAVLSGENESLKQQLQEAVARNDELEQTVEQVGAELTEARQASQEALVSYDEIKARITALETENTELQTKLGQISTISGGQQIVEPPEETPAEETEQVKE